MPDEKKKEPLHPETFFLPPLKMILAFFDKQSRPGEKTREAAEKEEKAVEKSVEKLIEKLSEEDQ